MCWILSNVLCNWWQTLIAQSSFVDSHQLNNTTSIKINRTRFGSANFLRWCLFIVKLTWNFFRQWSIFSLVMNGRQVKLFFSSSANCNNEESYRHSQWTFKVIFVRSQLTLCFNFCSARWWRKVSEIITYDCLLSSLLPLPTSSPRQHTTRSLVLKSVAKSRNRSSRRDIFEWFDDYKRRCTMDICGKLLLVMLNIGFITTQFSTDLLYKEVFNKRQGRGRKLFKPHETLIL